MSQAPPKLAALAEKYTYPEGPKHAKLNGSSEMKAASRHWIAGHSCIVMRLRICSVGLNISETVSRVCAIFLSFRSQVCLERLTGK